MDLHTSCMDSPPGAQKRVNGHGVREGMESHGLTVHVTQR